jgi:serine/threonine protein kinase
MSKLVTSGLQHFSCQGRIGMPVEELLFVVHQTILRLKYYQRTSRATTTPLIFGAWELSCRCYLFETTVLADNGSFALLTGKPPFQSATADEIYRRAREREYDWPKLDTSENLISQETKDLVSELLQGAEKRPDPDTIVQHPFFTCGWMPQSEEMTPDLRERQPNPDQFLSVGVRGGRTSLYARNLKKLCIKCEVGPWNPSPKQCTSTYREVAAEEKAGLTPAVPLPENVVYRPFDEWLREQAKQVIEHGEDAISAGEAFNKILEPLPLSKANEQLPSSSRPATQSFAAQQRARPRGTVAGQSSRSGKAREIAYEPSSRPIVTAPSRHGKSNSRKVQSKITEAPADVEDRLAADLVKQLNKAEKERKSFETEAPTLSLDTPVSLFNPRERLETLPNTKPDHILEGLRRLQTELERALNSRSIALETKTPPSSPTIVVKWVDYTNKFGLGYILSNGSVGCIFRATPASSSDPSKGQIPPSCVVVRDAERHLQQRNNENYVDRHQLVPVTGPNIEFYENRGEKGISRGKVNPANYRVAVNQNGEVGKLSRGQDEWDDRKREKIVLWKKFANYMTAFGRDQDYPFDDALVGAPRDRQNETVAAGNVVTFYQRFGDVGCWAFYDGHFQVRVELSAPCLY